ncbi:MAG: RsmB/NOP family class I SAM-dependent RNA methyltransferase [Caldimicrobium sp.]|nr:RsmB/NOP family class I SAM-dependent RNA methyltransferase [Caldimicrobium sp.]MCX7874424.1 RsmB/NOP family class I SAM-dependent RNA methyltransferase [Caldimicrobium sp.]MDW8093991.1 RsmB/NOP family class I SAM-dependent RNA methyltransferase [Caldimicrobium sp.]
MAKENKGFDYLEYFLKYKEIIPEFDEFLEYLEEPHQQYFRINTLKVNEEREKLLLEILKNKGVVYEEIKEVPYFYRVVNNQEISLGNLEEYQLGLIHSMTLSSALPVIALDPKPEELILDLCAAPGGKSALIAMITQDRAVIVANDKRLDRLTALSANMKRLGVTSIIITHYRGELFPMGISFDKILVDAPCSGEGRYKVGSEGELLYQRGTGRSNLPSIQKGLLIRAFDLLKPGGILVYSTCTINPEENEAVVDYLLRKRKTELLDWPSPFPYTPGLTEWDSKPFHPNMIKTKRFYSHKIRAVSFYVALLKRVE